MKYFRLNRISLTLLVLFVISYIILFILPFIITSSSMAGGLLVDYGGILMMALGILPVFGLITSFFAVGASGKLVLVIMHIIMALLYYFCGFWLLIFTYAAFANGY